MMDEASIKAILSQHAKWLKGEEGGSQAALCGAALRGADLGGASWCKATIDGMHVRPGDIGGPGEWLFALTAEEKEMIEQGREGRA